MKDKIEKLIKEVGINEVETILQQIKSKVNVKEELKKDFINLLTDCNISFDGDDIDYRKDGNLLFYYRKNEDFFRVKYDIWLKLESKYNLNYQELRELLVGVVEDVLNYKDVTPESWQLDAAATVEDVLNYKDVTPLLMSLLQALMVEDVLNYKDVTPGLE